ncbi:barrier-to-autointegration factor-like [Dermacentor andersoni]|uniref:barrier-to-autointegration factor-like n=1 Tax=Dermacentor andersoni TaxID=34620 RepID=UPI0024171CA9|nr:barrier-to-autointegration factor-like [Dermacentor andersoni]
MVTAAYIASRSAQRRAPHLHRTPSAISASSRLQPALRFDTSAPYVLPERKRAMSSTSKKHRNFVSEPMGEKDVTELAGVGDVLGGRLKDRGFDKAYVVLGQFLELKKDRQGFESWMKSTCSANSKQAGDCYECLRDWSQEFL